MLWNGERVQVEWTPSLRDESFKYLAKCDQILLADSIREKGLRYEYKVTGKGTPLVVFDKNPENTPQDETLSKQRYCDWINRRRRKPPSGSTRA